MFLLSLSTPSYSVSSAHPEKYDKQNSLENSTDPELLESQKILHHQVSQANHSERIELLENFLGKSDEELLIFFNHLPKPTQKLLFDSVITQDFALHFFQDIIKRPSLTENKKKLLNKTLSFFSIISLSKIATHLFESDPKFYYIFLSLINENKHLQTFLKIFTEKKQPLPLSVYSDLLETLAKEISTKNAEAPIALHYLLQIKPKQNEESWQELLLQGSALSSHAKYCALWCASATLRKRILQKNTDNLSNFTHLLKATVDLESDFEKKIKLILDFTTVLNETQLIEVIDNLIKYYPKILPYFLCGLKDEAFEFLFLSSSDYVAYQSLEIMKILNHSPINQETPTAKIAAKLSNQKRLDKLLKFLLVEHTSFTLEGLREEIDQIFNEPPEHREGTNEELVALLDEELSKISPFLLALCMYRPNYREFVHRCMPHWKEKQLESIGKMFTKKELESCFHVSPSLLPDLLNHLHLDLLAEICESQLQHMNLALRQFEGRLKNFIIHFNHLKTLIKEQQNISEEQYEDTLKQATDLEKIINKFYNPGYRFLEKKIEKTISTCPLKEKIFEDYLKHFHEIKVHQSTFFKKPFSQTFKELKQYFSKAGENEEESPLSLFPDYFLQLLTNEMILLLELPEMSSDTFTELSKLGIRSVEDLKVFGYSKQKENVLRLIRKTILDACLTEQKPYSLDPQIFWNTIFYKEPYSEDKLYTFIQQFHLESLPENTLKLLKDLTFREVFKDSNKLVFKNEKISDSTNCILQAFYLYHEYEITVQMKRYLWQLGNLENLKDVWKLLKEKNIRSLSDLVKQQNFSNMNIFDFKNCLQNRPIDRLK